MTDETGPAPSSGHSRWNAGRTLTVGTRVIVRRHLEPGQTSHLFTDVIGTVVEIGPPLLIRRADGTDVAIAPETIAVLKVLPARVIRNRDIRAVETATAAAFPGVEHRLVDGWLLRAGDGVTERSNSAVPIGPEAAFAPAPFAAIRAFYDSHDLPVRLQIPDRIARPTEDIVLADPTRWHRGPEIVVMTREITAADAADAGTAETAGPGATLGADAVAAATFAIDAQPDADWLARYHFRGRALPADTLRLLAGRIDGKMGFARLLLDGRTVAITRGTLTRSGDDRLWLGISAVEVDENLRRRGLGSRLERETLRWGARHGAQAAYLQAVATNTAGIALYERLGFTEHHRHRHLLLVEDATTGDTTDTEESTDG